MADSIPTPPVSPARTPATNVPIQLEDFRFENEGFPQEWVERYRPDGFFPVDLGDEFNHGRYRIIRKLGYGSTSTVWLATDTWAECFVAMKFVSAQDSRERNELGKHRRMALAERDPRSKYVLNLLEYFQLTGPNGTHYVFVFPPMGPSMDIFNDMPHALLPSADQTGRLPKQILKKVLSSVLKGLTFLHRANIVYGDLTPSNILFCTHDIGLLEERNLAQDMGTDPSARNREEVRRRDGKADRWSPQYLTMSCPLNEFVDLDSDPVVRLADFGHIEPSSHLPKPLVPTKLTPPEIMFGERATPANDIWRFGCLLFEFFTGTPLFNREKMFLRDAEKIDCHLLLLYDIIGPLPDSWMSIWPRSERYFGPERERLTSNFRPPFLGDGTIPDPQFVPDPNSIIEPSDNQASGSSDGICLEKHESESHMLRGETEDWQLDRERAEYEVLYTSVLDQPNDLDRVRNAYRRRSINNRPPGDKYLADPLDMIFKRKRISSIDDDDTEAVIFLLRKSLQLDPTMRASAEELMNHPWFQELDSMQEGSD